MSLLREYIHDSEGIKPGKKTDNRKFQQSLEKELTVIKLEISTRAYILQNKIQKYQ